MSTRAPCPVTQSPPAYVPELPITTREAAKTRGSLARSDRFLRESDIEAFLVEKLNDRPAAALPPVSGPADSPAELAVALPSPGYVIAERYRLERPLAFGGMGAVWVARHISLDVAVAVKLMAPCYVGSSRERARFIREARAAARLRSEHVVGALDYGVDRGLPYIVMDLLDGEDLDARLHREGALSIRAAASILAAVAEGLELAHAAGIIHRDLKPSNIFLARARGRVEEVVKILDFGIAKDLDARFEQERTDSGVVVGTPQYMSPEQVMGSKAIDRRTDLWSLGVVLFRALTGRLPFEGTALAEVADNILNGPPAVASRAAPHLSAEVDRFFDRALARDRRDRFQTANEMVQAFRRLLPGPLRACDAPSLPPACGVFELSSGDRIAAAIPRQAASDGAAGQSAAALPRRSASWWLVCLGLIATLAVIALVLTGSP
jgi:serine/threonine-protein kinase